MKVKNMNKYTFKLSVKGDLVENSVDALDLANTIIATSQVLSEISKIEYGEGSKKVKININAFQQGSLLTEFLIYMTEDPAKTLALGATTVLAGEKMLDILLKVIKVKKELKGKSPKKISQADNGVNFEIHTGDNSVVVVDSSGIQALQNRSINKNLDKVFKPLQNENTQISSIDFITENETIATNRKESEYMLPIESYQNVDDVTYKGFVSKLDSKVRSGFLSIGSSRISFTYDDQLSKEEYYILCSSLRTKVKIVVKGDAVMDYEGNVKSIVVNKILNDETLF